MFYITHKVRHENGGHEHGNGNGEAIRSCHVFRLLEIKRNQYTAYA